APRERGGEPPASPGELPAPDLGRPQADAVARRLKDVLDKGDPDEVRKLEEATGMTREDMENFARKFEKPEQAPVGEGRDLTAAPAHPNPPAPPADMGERVKCSVISGRGQRGAGSTVQDTNSNQTQGNRAPAPPEIRSRYETYLNTISRSKPGTGSGGGR